MAADAAPAERLAAGKGSESTIWIKIKIPLSHLTNLVEHLPRSCSYGMRKEAAQANGKDFEVDGRRIYDAFAAGRPAQERVINETHFNYLDRHPDGTQNNEDLGFRYYAQRSPFAVNSDSRGKTLILSTDVEFKAAGAQRNAILGLFWGFASVGCGDNWPATIQTQFRSLLEPTEDFRVSMKSSIEVAKRSDLSVTTFDGRVRVLSSDQVVEKLNNLISPLSKEVDRQVSKLSFQPIVKDGWSKLSKPIELGKGFFANVAPKQLLASQIAIEDGHLTIRCGMVATMTLSDKATPTVSGDLPRLELVDAADRPFQLNAGIEVSAARLNELAQKLRGHAFDFGAARMTLGEVSVALADDRVRISLLNAIINQGKNEYKVDAVLTTSPQFLRDGDMYYFVPGAIAEKCDWVGEPIKAWLAKQIGFDPKQILQNELSKLLKIDITKYIEPLLPQHVAIAKDAKLELRDLTVGLGE